MNKSEKIIEKFREGNFVGVDSVLLEQTTTAISHVFLGNTKAWKIYKGDNIFFNKSFNDLSNKEIRFLFTKKDFAWNNKLSPEIYTELKGVLLDENEQITLVDPSDSADELVIVMNKMDMSKGLFNLLSSNQISAEDCYQIGKQLGERTKNLPQEEVERNLYKDFVQRINDLKSWLAGVEKHIPSEEAGMYIDVLIKFIEKNKNSFVESVGMIGPCVDIHADNALFVDGKLLPIDTYAPKEDWLYGYKFINVYRVATDIYALLGKDFFEEVLKGFEESSGERLPREFDKELILYCELITCPYQYMLAEHNTSRMIVAEKYHEFLKSVYLMF